MPYKSSKIKLRELQDRRRRLTSEQKERIFQMYRGGGWSLRTLANHFDVSKKTILLIVNPVSLANERAYRKANWKQFQRSKEYRAKAAREHRQYKQQLYLAGELYE